jgi:2-amino-4-hydroxy-6-hydroxymethyldihydropteridine diphosphokinase
MMGGERLRPDPTLVSPDEHSQVPQLATAYLGLGSNLGDRERNLRSALAALSEVPGIRVRRQSRFIETTPWGDLNQPDFMNAVIEIETDLDPRELLRTLKRIERQLGRTPSRRWGPRVIDIDILTWDGLRIQTAELTIPHPYILNRPFVWQPLSELAPELVEELRRDATLPL